MIGFKKQPNFKKTIKYFNKLLKIDPKKTLEKYGRLGVQALSRATPKDTSEAANSWDYKIEGNRERYELTWTNNDLAGQVPVVILIQYGHATKSGGFVSGRDFINPALKPVFDSLQADLRKEVNP